MLENMPKTTKIDFYEKSVEVFELKTQFRKTKINTILNSKRRFSLNDAFVL